MKKKRWKNTWKEKKNQKSVSLSRDTQLANKSGFAFFLFCIYILSKNIKNKVKKYENNLKLCTEAAVTWAAIPRVY